MSAAAAAALLVAAVLAAAVAVVRRRVTTAERPLRVVDRLPLGKESGVALVRCQGRELLVGYGASGVVHLDTTVAGESP